jgi:peptide-methionine (R)-S-oxide reductase
MSDADANTDDGASEPAESDLPKTDEEWRERLTEEEYRILRERGTEPKFSGEFLDVDDEGEFTCAGCGAVLFSTDQQFESGHGWPSFFDVVAEDTVETRLDTSHGMRRTEVVCATCGGHLGHVFDDGPDPTGKRYCINSAALDFDAEE